MMAIIAISSTKILFAQSKTDPSFNQLLSTYYEVKNALAADKKELAVQKAKTLSAKVDAVPHKDLPATQHTLWMEQAKILKAKATELASGKDIKAQRKAFEGIS